MLFLRRPLFAVIASSFVACSGLQQLPYSVAVSNSAVESRPLIGSGSWMSSDAVGHKLLYISNWQTSDVSVFTYPGRRLVGTLTGFQQPYGECVDNSGNVFITNFNASNIYEFHHGKLKPKAIIDDPGEHPAGCSVDPTTGDLAVNNSYTVGNEAGSISLFERNSRGGWSAVANYTDSNFFYMYFCGFDSSGDLYVDGMTGYNGSFALAVLPHASSAFTNLTLSQSVTAPGGIMWDGQYMTVADSGVSPSSIYRFSVSGNAATVVGSTVLSGSDVVQYWIDGPRVVGPQPKTAKVGIWKYPAGGKALRVVKENLDVPSGLTISP
jgi:hypothetical protein